MALIEVTGETAARLLWVVYMVFWSLLTFASSSGPSTTLSNVAVSLGLIWISIGIIVAIVHINSKIGVLGVEA